MDVPPPASGALAATRRRQHKFFEEHITPLPPTKKPDATRFAIVDIETEAIGHGRGTVEDFILGGYILDDGDAVRYFRSPREWMDILLAPEHRGLKWYAHNGGEFDYKYLLDEFNRALAREAIRVVQVIAQGESRVIGFVLWGDPWVPPTEKKPGHWTRICELRDSYALMPASLDELSKKLAPSLAKLSGTINWDRGERFDPANAQHLAYLERDVLALRAVIQQFRQLVWDHFRCTTGWTAPSTAMRAWRTSLEEKAAFPRLSREQADFIRQAYFGGLVFLTTTAPHAGAKHYDVNSMYPSVMKADGVPGGKAKWVDREFSGRPGFYHCAVEAPESLAFTFVGYRAPHGATWWPTGHFHTWMSTQEIAHARASGYRVKTGTGVVFSEVVYPFQDFLTLCETLRREHRGTAVEFVVKIMQNGLYGKFAQRDDAETLLFAEDPPEDDGQGHWEPVIDARTGALRQYLWHRAERARHPMRMVHWSAWITASARWKLARAVLAVGRAHVYYGDTDSVVGDAVMEQALAEAGDIGSAYGQWKLEKIYRRFQASAPKVYVGEVDDQVVILKAKGIPHKRVTPHQLQLTGEQQQPVVYYAGANSTRSLLSGKKAVFWEDRKRRYSDLQKSSGWQETSGQVFPTKIS